MADNRLYDAKVPMSVHDTLTASEISTVENETLSFIRQDGTPDAGDPAGTIVYAVLDKSPILNLLGDRVGRFDGTDLDSSITFTDGVIIASQEKGFVMNGAADNRLTITASKLTTDGDWALDYETGMMVIRKASAATSISITSYKVKKQFTTPSSGGGSLTEVILTNPDGTSPQDQTNNALRTEDINPDWSRWIGETLADVTNETNTTTERYIDMDGYNRLTIQFVKSGGVDIVTLTVEGSCQDDGTVASLATYQDISQYGLTISTAASTAASYIADCILNVIDASNYKYIKVQTVSAGGANDADYAIYIKKWFA